MEKNIYLHNMKLYKIINTIEIDNIDFSYLDQEKETVRYSVDGSKFIISSDLMESDEFAKTQEEMISIINSPEWSNERII